MTQNIRIYDHEFILHASGAVFWKGKATLLISDVHLGKVSHFRKFGAAVPLKAIGANFELLDEVIAYFNPEKIIFLGDLFHAHLNTEWIYFEAWIAQIATEVILINGNHDVISPLKYEALGIEIHDELILDKCLLTHHPEPRQGYFNFCGHIHPAVKIQGSGKQSLRLPCFFKTQDQMILPAFGKFTGSYTLKRKKEDEVYALAEGMVIKI
ncbi:ligase-associated DNA damage response endonuclease PdeM [Maribacter sp. ANRC-HE7]|uniref:Ligase-associated DNA damage response endonuclease PdeM n=1 Tax=Maribacter aquimaris TaxID=2737171 RepID=A0ABR7V423_9FLAO|nr:ligase-associated DNA damage response endonuclease PdeM [Maribacter aquimaris]MBD0779544.1 ligase-associated DNA damage response endonuclease PdeM [Maribacter aquimaris]